jgi:hypothetical protein
MFIGDTSQNMADTSTFCRIGVAGMGHCSFRSTRIDAGEVEG